MPYAVTYKFTITPLRDNDTNELIPTRTIDRDYQSDSPTGNYNSNGEQILNANTYRTYLDNYITYHFVIPIIFAGDEEPTNDLKNRVAQKLKQLIAQSHWFADTIISRGYSIYNGPRLDGEGKYCRPGYIRNKFKFAINEQASYLLEKAWEANSEGKYDTRTYNTVPIMDYRIENISYEILNTLQLDTQFPYEEIDDDITKDEEQE